MSTAGQFAAMVEAGESETMEFKATTGTLRQAAMTVCAMLNGHGGHVLFGVTQDGLMVGQQTSDRTIEQVSAEFRRIDPPAYPEIERLPVASNRVVIAVAVRQGPAKPYQYRGTAYRRVGNTTLAMSADEYNRILFERMHSERRWENQPAAGWTVDDLDVAEIRNSVAEAVRIGRLNEPGNREPEDLLRGLGLFRDGILLRAAAVLFGSAERLEYEMPQCLLRVARFPGTDRTEFLDNRQFNGNAFALLSYAERFLRDTLPIAGRFEPDRIERIDDPLYPPLAIREALANALCHRDYAIGGGSVGVAAYDDRLEITSSGDLHFGLTPEKLFEPHESLPWNPLIARTFYRRGIIEEWGRGTVRMAELATSAGQPHPEIEDAGGCVTVRFRPAATRSAGPVRVRGIGATEVGGYILNERQQAILDLLARTDHSLALREIRSQLVSEVNERRLREDLALLKGKGLIAASGHGRGARWNRA